MEERRRRHPLLPPLLFVLDGTGPADIENRVTALRAAARPLTAFLRDVPVLTAPLTDLLQHGPSASVWSPVHAPGRRVPWSI
ncbi:hypothetical protein [Streptomyces canus]|uniref:hypothetical protein n=1 Tax=Streptomyces canus TaxID=58343 RepID=UPI000365C72F|nr:hypothetical protein [Streptomyces canus]